jgi:uncharacterized repeat protein (TIGR03803 family)
MRVVLIVAAIGSASLHCGAAQAAGASFSVITTLSGPPAIGALYGGKLYGIMATGGSNGAGMLFSVTASGQFADLRDFVAATDGSSPNAPLAVGTSGSIWGTAQSGGANGGGTLFEWTPAGFSVPHAFGAGMDGSLPLQGPVVSPGGGMIGTAAGGAVSTNGNLWFYGSSKYWVLHDFLSGADGHCPFSGPTRSAQGVIYGTTVGRGFGGNPTGSIWQFAKGQLTTIYVFQDGNDGEWPDQAPVTDPGGNLYGTTHVQNGVQFAGAIWKLAPGGAFTVLHDLNGATDGYGPNGPLILNTDGYLYGTTASGGAANSGTVFRISPTGTFELVYAFKNAGDGANPTGPLVHNAAGAIFGGTATGTVFRIRYSAPSLQVQAGN